MNLLVAGVTDMGRVRPNNEDCFIAEERLRLFAVADGMGGYAAGEVASRAAIDALRAGVEERAAAMGEADAVGDSWRAQSLFEEAVQRACSEVFQLAQTKAHLKGMGTTLSAIWFSPRRAAVAHVGDCRIYLVRRGEAHRLTEDHALLPELIRQGRLSEAEAQSFPYPNAVTRAIGPHPVVEVDTLDLEVMPGDRFLVCSDGLHRYFRRGEVAQLIEQCETVEMGANELVRLANERGGADNVTAVVVAVSDMAATGTTHETERKIEVFRQMPLFRYLTYRELVQVLSLTTMRHYKAGQTIIREGVAGDEMYVVFSGRVAVKKGEAVLSYLEGGGPFGEMALVDQDPRSATVLAVDNTRLLVLPRKRLYTLLRKEPPVAVKLLWNIVQVLSGRLRTANTELSELKVDAFGVTTTAAVAAPFVTDEPTLPPDSKVPIRS